MGVHKIDQIILSCNEDPIYMEFWPMVATAYKRLFPDVTVHLAFLTRRQENDALVEYFRNFGQLTLYRPLSHIPEFAQAKMIRFILASEQGHQTCYIDDIDLLPLQREFITDKTSKRPAGRLMCVGGEVYRNNGCYPASQMTAEGEVWRKFINPNNDTYEGLWNKWTRTTPVFDEKENPMIAQDFDKGKFFSDECLLRRLIDANKVPKYEIPRGYDDYMASTVDRWHFNSQTNTWDYHKNRLKAGMLVNCHGLRPYSKYKEHYQPLIEYIETKYP